MPRKNPIAAAFANERAKAKQYQVADGEVRDPPRRTGPRFRGLKPEHDLVRTTNTFVTIDEARQMMRTETQQFAASDEPYMLLVAAPPSVGKTTLAIELAEQFAMAGKRVLFLGPRTDFFVDIITSKACKHPSYWVQWHGRNHTDAEGNFDLCYRAPDIDVWMKRGYDAINFCANAKICGWSYINDGCPYHAQKQTTAPIVFGQHAHLTLGHPLMKTFDVVIGDENPLDAFMRHWIIPGDMIVPGDMDPTEPLTEIVHELASLAGRDTHAEGPDLMTLLGGATQVREACDMFTMPVDAVAVAPNLRRAEDVDEVPYFHLPHLVRLLRQEATAAEAGTAYPPRIAIAKGKLHLLLRYDVNPEAPSKILWLDGTANQQLYESMFKRPVAVVEPKVALQSKIYQVWPRTNGKRSLVDGEGTPTGKATQLQQQVAQIVRKHGYTNPMIVTFNDLEKLFTGQRGHFYGLRGTNQFEHCDALIIAGTPQPALTQIHTMARMIHDTRMTAFDQTWSDRDVVYNTPESSGVLFSYPVGGFWQDPDLQALQWQKREAEIIQVAHRVRPVLRDVDIWLLTNIPISELPPTKLLTIHDLFDAPPDVNAYRWIEVLALADEFYATDKPLRSVDLVERMDISAPSARRYLDCLEEQQPERWKAEKVLVPNKAGKVGRPAQALVPQTLNT